MMSERINAVARRRQCQHSGVQRHMADIERQAEEVADLRKEAHHIAENDAGAPGCDVVLEPVSKALHASRADFLPQGMLCDGGGNAVVDGKVLAPSADDGGSP